MVFMPGIAAVIVPPQPILLILLALIPAAPGSESHESRADKPYVDRHTSTRRTVSKIALIVVSVCARGFWIDFIPSEEWARVGRYLAYVLGISAPLPLYWAISNNHISLAGTPNVVQRIGIYALTTLFATFLLWIVLVHGLGAAVTLTFGEEARESLGIYMTKNDGDGLLRLGCEYRLEGELLQTAFPPRLCVAKVEFASIPE